MKEKRRNSNNNSKSHKNAHKNKSCLNLGPVYHLNAENANTKMSNVCQKYKTRIETRRDKKPQPHVIAFFCWHAIKIAQKSECECMVNRDLASVDFLIDFLSLSCVVLVFFRKKTVRKAIPFDSLPFSSFKTKNIHAFRQKLKQW